MKNLDPKKLERFNELIDLGEKVLQTKSRVRLGDFGSYDEVDDSASSQWAMKCLPALEETFGKGSLHYNEFNKLFNGFTSIKGYDYSRRALAVLKAAKEVYENGHVTEKTSESNTQISESSNITEHLINSCELEAKRNARIYSSIIFVILATIAQSFFIFLALIYPSSHSSCLLLVISCLLYF